jgi:hypothetical protein
MDADARATGEVLDFIRAVCWQAACCEWPAMLAGQLDSGAL